MEDKKNTENFYKEVPEMKACDKTKYLRQEVLGVHTQI